MLKRIVHVEMSDKASVDFDADGLNRGLKGLAEKAEDSCDFEGVLNNAIQALYQSQPHGPVYSYYGGQDARFGKVWLSKFNAGNRPGKVNIEFTPSAGYKARVKYPQKTIGVIDLRGRTYSVAWDGEYDETRHGLPEILMRDTEKVMEYLGLTRESKD